ncbi:MAG TPA: type 4a pilus biogenesis protein PilO [Terriglobia bacterium]|jgi:hypothetical protein
MKTYRRQRQHYLFAGVLGTIAVVNILFYVILYRPVRSEYFRLQDSIQKTRVEGTTRRQKIDRLDKLSKQLETSAQDRAQLITMHFLPRTPGWSELLPLLEEAVQKTGVKNLHQDYTIDQAPQYGLYSVKIRLPVTGPYQNVVNLLKELEESQTFFIINSIDVQGGSETATRDLVMALNLETFFYQ